VRIEGVVSWAIWVTGRPGNDRTTPPVHVAEAVRAWPVTLKVLDLAGARRALVGRGRAAPAAALNIAPDFRSTVEDVLLLARRLHRAAAAPVTPAGRNVP
jgi:hypothetical protein